MGVIISPFRSLRSSLGDASARPPHRALSPENREEGECEHRAHAEPVITAVVLGASRTRFNVTGVVLRELSVPTAIRS